MRPPPSDCYRVHRTVVFSILSSFGYTTDVDFLSVAWCRYQSLHFLMLQLDRYPTLLSATKHGLDELQVSERFFW